MLEESNTPCGRIERARLSEASNLIFLVFNYGSNWGGAPTNNLRKMELEAHAGLQADILQLLLRAQVEWTAAEILQSHEPIYGPAASALHSHRAVAFRGKNKCPKEFSLQYNFIGSVHVGNHRLALHRALCELARLLFLSVLIEIESMRLILSALT